MRKSGKYGKKKHKKRNPGIQCGVTEIFLISLDIKHKYSIIYN